MKMLLGSEVPYFEKKMTHPMLQRNERVSIPASFIHAHGHMLDAVISLTGPIGHARSVAIKTYPCPIRGRGQSVRVYLSAGWKEFVKENGFQEGDFVLFRLVETSCFLVSLKLQKNVVYKTPPLLYKCVKERGRLGKYGREDYGTGYLTQSSSNSRFPWFTSKLTKTNLGDHVHHLEMPIRFAEEYGHQFQERVLLLGPCGLRRIVKLKVSSTVRTTTIRVHFRHGWKDFALENGFKKGDLLLFSLVGLSKFVVQVFTDCNELSGVLYAC